MQFRRKAKKLPVVLSVEEVGDLLSVAAGPGLKYRAALSISYGAGLRAYQLQKRSCYAGTIHTSRSPRLLKSGSGGKRSLRNKLAIDVFGTNQRFAYFSKAAKHVWEFAFA